MLDRLLCPLIDLSAHMFVGQSEPSFMKSEHALPRFEHNHTKFYHEVDHPLGHNIVHSMASSKMFGQQNLKKHPQGASQVGYSIC